MGQKISSLPDPYTMLRVLKVPPPFNVVSFYTNTSLTKVRRIDEFINRLL